MFARKVGRSVITNTKLIHQSLGSISRPARSFLPLISTSHQRCLYNNRSDSNSQHHASMSASIQTQNEPYCPMTELSFKLNEIKVFQDEQIIQLVFKSGQTMNYTMSWLRNLCSCSSCLANKFQMSGHNSIHSVNSARAQSDTKLSVVRIKCNAEDELEIEWLDNQYKSHQSRYSLKYLNIYSNIK